MKTIYRYAVYALAGMAVGFKIEHDLLNAMATVDHRALAVRHLSLPSDEEYFPLAKVVNMGDYR